MNEKDKANCLLELNKSRLDHFMQTRTIEFQVNIAIWSLIVVGGAYFYEKIYITGWESCIVFIFIAFVIFALHFIWMILIQNSEDIDHRFMEAYRLIIDDLTGITVKEPQPRESFKFIIGQLKKLKLTGWHWIILEIAMTLSLLFGVGILLSLPKNNQNVESNLIKYVNVNCPQIQNANNRDSSLLKKP